MSSDKSLPIVIEPARNRVKMKATVSPRLSSSLSPRLNSEPADPPVFIPLVISSEKKSPSLTEIKTSEERPHHSRKHHHRTHKKHSRNGTNQEIPALNFFSHPEESKIKPEKKFHRASKKHIGTGRKPGKESESPSLLAFSV